jgi:hypothetical protein
LEENVIVRFEVLTVVKMLMLFFWVVTLSSEDGDIVSLKHWYVPTSPHGITTQKVNGGKNVIVSNSLHIISSSIFYCILHLTLILKKIKFKVWHESFLSSPKNSVLCD